MPARSRKPSLISAGFRGKRPAFTGRKPCFCRLWLDDRISVYRRAQRAMVVSRTGTTMHGPFPDRLCLPLAFDPAGLATDLAGHSGIAWTSHFVEQNYQGDWSVIALRAPAAARHPIQ